MYLPYTYVYLCACTYYRSIIQTSIWVCNVESWIHFSFCFETVAHGPNFSFKPKIVYVYCISKNIVLLYSILQRIRKLKPQTLLQMISPEEVQPPLHPIYYIFKIHIRLMIGETFRYVYIMGYFSYTDSQKPSQVVY